MNAFFATQPLYAVQATGGSRRRKQHIKLRKLTQNSYVVGRLQLLWHPYIQHDRNDKLTRVVLARTSRVLSLPF